MQCASSTTSRPTRSANSGSIELRNSGLLRRSGLISSRSTSSLSSARLISDQSSRLVELIVRALRPSRSAAATWLRISASSGETISVGPAPRARSSEVATKYTADLPQPVRCTQSTRARSVTRSLIASSWCSRKEAFGPASWCRRASASASNFGSIAEPGAGEVITRILFGGARQHLSGERSEHVCERVRGLFRGVARQRHVAQRHPHEQVGHLRDFKLRRLGPVQLDRLAEAVRREREHRPALRGDEREQVVVVVTGEQADGEWIDGDHF